MFGRDAFGIDLGSNACKVFSAKKGVIRTEKNKVAIRKRERLLAVGDEAYEMLEKNPPSVEVISPIRDGAISDIDMTEVLLHTILLRTDVHIGVGPHLYYATPCRCSELEKKAYPMISNAANLTNPHVFLVDRPICDAVALGIPLSRTQGAICVNLGAEHSEMTVISNGQMLLSVSVDEGGSDLNEDICNLVRRRHHLLIGKRTANRLKVVLADLTRSRNEARYVTGINTLSGLPRQVVITSGLIYDAIIGRMDKIAGAIREFLERIPPQVLDAVRADSIYVCGGGSAIPNLESYLSRQLSIPVHVSSLYENATIQGLKEIMEDKTLSKWVTAV